MRMRMSDGKVITAGAFLPHVLECNLMSELDAYVLAKVLQTLRDNPFLRISVNLCVKSIVNKAWQEILHQAHDQDPAVTSRLIIELTEHAAVADIEALRNFMICYRKLGVAFAMDDFGAGYTSIRHFKTLPFDICKIDGDFVQALTDDSGARVIFHSLAKIARHFEMLVVAECVENEKIAMLAEELGADAVQGFLYGRGDATPSHRLSHYVETAKAIAG